MAAVVERGLWAGGTGGSLGSEVLILTRSRSQCVRAMTSLNRVMDLPGIRIAGVDPDSLTGTGAVLVDVAPQRWPAPSTA